MSETICYSPDGIEFSLKGPLGNVIAEQQVVPETGVAYLVTKAGPRVVFFPIYTMQSIGGITPLKDTVYELRPIPTLVVGGCGTANDIADANDVEDDDEDEQDEDDEDVEDDEPEEDEEFDDEDDDAEEAEDENAE